MRIQEALGNELGSYKMVKLSGYNTGFSWTALRHQLTFWGNCQQRDQSIPGQLTNLPNTSRATKTATLYKILNNFVVNITRQKCFREISQNREPVSDNSHWKRLLPRLSWSWAMLLPSDTYRKPITSITAVLLPFVTYLQTVIFN
jgi:hypothetical protein